MGGSMRIPQELVLELVNWGVDAFSKRRRVRKALQKMEEAGIHYKPFLSGRAKIDAAADENKHVTLNKAEVQALDFVMDQFSRSARRARRKLREANSV